MSKKYGKIGHSWSYRYRRINGHLKRVKVRRLSNGKICVRVVGHRNTTDRRIRRRR